MNLEQLLDRRELLRLSAIAAGTLTFVDAPQMAEARRRFWQLDRTHGKQRVAVFTLHELDALVNNGSIELVGADPVLSLFYPPSETKKFKGYYDVHFQSGKVWRMKPDESRFHVGVDRVLRVNAVVDGSILDFSNQIQLPRDDEPWLGHIVTAHEEWR